MMLSKGDIIGTMLRTFVQRTMLKNHQSMMLRTLVKLLRPNHNQIIPKPGDYVRISKDGYNRFCIEEVLGSDPKGIFTVRDSSNNKYSIRSLDKSAYKWEAL